MFVRSSDFSKGKISMGVELDVWAEHKIDFGMLAAEALDFFEFKTEKKPAHRSRSDKKQIKETSQTEEIQYFADFDTLETNFKRNKKIELTTNFAYCHRIIIYPKTINYWGKGFYTRDTRWMELITKNFEDKLHWNEESAAEYTKNWQSFRNFCREMTLKLGGEKIVYIRDNFNMIDKFYAGESLQNGIEHEVNTGVNQYYELDLVEYFPDDFKNKYVWFFEDLKEIN